MYSKKRALSNCDMNDYDIILKYNDDIWQQVLRYLQNLRAQLI